MVGWRTIERGLSSVSLPALKRFAVAPDDDPTEELACWGVTIYAYSSIAHLRRILAGLSLLADIGNAPAAEVLTRHVFEWAAHACYAESTLKQLFEKSNWTAAFELLLQIDGGKLWIKNHGGKYGADDLQRETPKPLHVMKLVKAYNEYQTDIYGEGDALDAYGFLSEHSHPNGACFLHYRELSGDEARFVDPTPSDPRGIDRPVLEWLIFIHGLLGLAKENTVRPGILAVLKTVALLGCPPRDF